MNFHSFLHHREGTIQKWLKPEDFFNLFPCFVRPIKDELTSSWLYRLAHAHHLKVFTFCRIALNNKTVWNRDIDKCITADLLYYLSIRNNITFSEAFNTTLKSYEGILFNTLNINGGTNWISPLGIYHRTRTRNSLMCCPSCFKECSIIYYKKAWRLSLPTICPKCKVSLIDHCPICKQPIIFHRHDIGNKNKIENSNMASCCNCSFDFRNIIPENVNDRDHQNQVILNELLKGKSHFNLKAPTFFKILRIIIRVLNSRSKFAYPFQKEVFKQMNIRYRPSLGGYENQFEFLNILRRRELLNMSMWVMNHWPNRFININNTSKTGGFIWLNDKNIPIEFDKVIRENIVKLSS
ncbi:MAG: TniQ family protein [Cyclobacteriaceae bacterium]